jgi:hypothetical protein
MTKLSTFILLDAAGHELGNATSNDLIDGARVRCTYTAAEGNPMGFFGSFGFGDWGRYEDCEF